MIGTPYYLSPEVWKRDQYDYKTDMWSLGVVASGRCKKIPSYYSEELSRLISSLMSTDSG
jgi:serine/threonine protein kinase